MYASKVCPFQVKFASPCNVAPPADVITLLLDASFRLSGVCQVAALPEPPLVNT